MKATGKTVKRTKTHEVYPKARVAQTIMYQNMSSHYRRIYNAKPRVDTGPPFSHRPVKPCIPSKPIIWNKSQNECHMPQQSKSSITLTSTKCSRQGCGDRPTPSFKPQLSSTATDTESKLRSLRVYHPPRRRVYSSSATSIQIKSDPEVSVPDIPWIRTTEEVKTTPSKGSSSDSAYTEEGEVWSGGESRGPTPISDAQRAISSDNLMYVKFVRGITEEVLRKGIFTNKALKKIFQSHIDSHKQYLNLRRMQEEVEKLQLELGIPKEDELDNTDYRFGYTSSSSEDSEKIQCSKFEDTELMDALSQLNISPSLKADIANSLGLYSSNTSYRSVSSSESLKLSRSNTKHTTFSSPLEVIHDISHSKTDKFDHQQKVPQSDDDSYEMLSEGSESRPLTPLGLAW